MTIFTLTSGSYYNISISYKYIIKKEGYLFLIYLYELFLFAYICRGMPISHGTLKCGFWLEWKGQKL